MHTMQENTEEHCYNHIVNLDIEVTLLINVNIALLM